MLIPSNIIRCRVEFPSLSRRVNANSQRYGDRIIVYVKLIKKGEC